MKFGGNLVPVRAKQTLPMRGENSDHASWDVDLPLNESKHPTKIPDELLSYFTMNGKLKVYYHLNNFSMYYNEKFLDHSKKIVWKENQVKDLMHKAKIGHLKGYTYYDVNNIIKLLRMVPNLEGGRILVIGSQAPWLEACCLPCALSRWFDN